MYGLNACLWFDGQAEEAAEFYTAVFPNSKIVNVVRAPADGTPSNDPGAVMVVEFNLDGRDFVALNGGPMYKFSEAVSFQVHVEDQAEVDHFWKAFTAGGGQAGPCGWCKDRFGLSWQVIPRRLLELMQDPDPERSRKAFASMMTMTRIDVAALEAAVS